MRPPPPAPFAELLSLPPDALILPSPVRRPAEIQMLPPAPAPPPLAFCPLASIVPLTSKVPPTARRNTPPPQPPPPFATVPPPLPGSTGSISEPYVFPHP